jgi:hypothetical protein
MNRIYKIFVIIPFILFSFSAQTHVEHYKDLNKIEFDIYRNDKHIGKHVFSFKNEGNNLEVESEINFEIKKLGVVLYKYNVKGTEYYKEGKLIKFNSKTKQNKKEKFVNLSLENNDFLIDGSSYKGKASADFVLGTWWNHSIVKAKSQISAVSGRIIDQKVTFLGEEEINVNNQTYKTLHFNFSSTDEKLNKDKKLNTDIWYDKNTLNWIKASFNKQGRWEYRLVLLK